MKAKYKNSLIATLSGIVTGLSVILPSQLGWLAWGGIVGFFYLLLAFVGEGASLGRYYRTGLLFFTVFYACAFHFFLYMHPLDFTGIYGFASVLVVVFCWVALPLLQGSISAVFILLFGLCARLGAFRRARALEVPTLAVGYVMLEWFQTVGWWGVPFARLSLSQTIGSYFFGSASLFGSYFITLCVCAVNACIAYSLIGLKQGGARSLIKNLRLWGSVALSVFLLNLTLGIATTCITDSRCESEEKLTVAVLQGNFSSKSSYDADPFDIVAVYQDLTKQVCEGGEVDLVVWPETALPCTVNPNGSLENEVRLIAKECGVPIIWGGLRHDIDTYANCFFYTHSDGEMDTTVYEKRHLVPFGEYMPMRSILTLILPFMEEISMLSSDMTPGYGTKLFDVEGIGKVGSLICFDSIYEDLSLDTVRDGAELIVLGTNDSWFSCSVAIYIHNNQARLRAVETGRYIARSAVTGVSTVISPSGRVLAETELLTEDYATCEVSPRSDRTLYSYIGNTLVLVCALFFIGVLAFGIYERKTAKAVAKTIDEGGRDDDEASL
ncbi:MAG: apolipoprotein N-acyltransferase [Clostridia bacterium]|nr:apolipoprotein N-acyltransferase [Clostridia bacterium]